MAHYIELLRRRTDAERKGHFPSVHGEWAYKIATGMYAKVLGDPKVVDEGNGMDDCGTLKYTCRVPNHLTLKEVQRLLSTTYGRDSGCGHDYDCCGCSSYTVVWGSVRRIRRGQFSFHLRHSRNY